MGASVYPGFGSLIFLNILYFYFIPLWLGNNKSSSCYPVFSHLRLDFFIISAWRMRETCVLQPKPLVSVPTQNDQKQDKVLTCDTILASIRALQLKYPGLSKPGCDVNTRNT